MVSFSTQGATASAVFAAADLTWQYVPKMSHMCKNPLMVAVKSEATWQYIITARNVHGRLIYLYLSGIKDWKSGFLGLKLKESPMAMLVGKLLMPVVLQKAAYMGVKMVWEVQPYKSVSAKSKEIVLNTVHRWQLHPIKHYKINKEIPDVC